MNKEYRFLDDMGRFINWNALLPLMLDTWRAVQVTKSDDGEIVVRVIELPAAPTALCINPDHLRKDPNEFTRHIGGEQPCEFAPKGGE